MIDGLIPLAEHSPTTVAELSAIVKAARVAGHAVYPVGGRTMTGFGLPPTKPGVAVDLTRLNQVIDYPARDMTVTVQAGIRLAELQAVLATENQELPVDVPLPDRATLGGSIAVNASGPRRFGCGTLRDYVIGITLMNDEGEAFKAGGRVVKNVAGYDIMKLATGSLGTLGVITQVTLKVKPKAGASEWLALPCPEAEVPMVLGILNRTRTRPSAVVLTVAGPDRNHRRLRGQSAGRRVASHPVARRVTRRPALPLGRSPAARGRAPAGGPARLPFIGHASRHV